MRETRVSMVLLVSGLLATGLAAQEVPAANADLADQGDAGSPVAEASPAVSGVDVLRLIRFSGTARGAQGQALAGTVGITFALYAEQEGGAPLWLETQNVRLDPQGRYTALLGVTSNEGLPLEVFASGEARWLGIQMQGQAEQRVLLVSVPYALKAAEAERLSGRKASDFVLSEQLSTRVEEEISTQIEQQGLVTTEEAGTLAQVSGSGTPGRIAKFTSPTAVGDSVVAESSGNIGIGVTSPTQKLVVGVGAGGGSALNLSNLNNQDLQVLLSAAAAPDRVALVGPSTPTNLALGVGGTERLRITNAGNIGIGFKTPVQRLVVASRPSGGPTVTVTNGANQDLQLSVSGRAASDRVALVAPSTGTNLALGVGGTEKMRITNAGNVGIGTTTPSANATLDVASSVFFGIRGITDLSSGIGLWGEAPNIGVQGESTSSTGTVFGVVGRAASSSVFTAGVLGEALDNTGEVYGVRGTGVSSNGAGVLGLSPNVGVIGRSSGINGTGVEGEATGASGTNFGVHGTASNVDGIGVKGTAPLLGVVGEATGGAGTEIGVQGIGQFGVQGDGTDIGLRGVVLNTDTQIPVVGVSAFVQNGAGTAAKFINNNAGGDLIVGQVSSNQKFRVEGSGDVFADGSYNCGLGSGCFNTGVGADLAERIDTTKPLEPGDVVEIDPTRPGHFRQAQIAYSTMVAGIVSTAPAITLANNDLTDNDTGERTDTRPLLALAGRVPVKVTDEGGPIRIGDLLTSSSVPGQAMRCADRQACAGAIVGKALGALQRGAGVIEVLVTLQ